jgi:hypothetical protein
MMNERQDDWRDGIAVAFTHFGGHLAKRAK